MFFEKEKADLISTFSEVTDLANEIQNYVAKREISRVHAQYQPLISFMNESELKMEQQWLTEHFSTISTSLVKKEKEFYDILKKINIIEGKMEERAIILGRFLAYAQVPDTTFSEISKRMDEEYPNHAFWSKEISDSLINKINDFDDQKSAVEFLIKSISELSTALIRGGKDRVENQISWKDLSFKDMNEVKEANNEIRRALRAIKDYQMALVELQKQLV